jgi:hypothetical protein
VTPLFVFCADLHLEDGAWSTRPGIYGDAYYSFQQIIDYCIEHRLPLIMGGDILEKKQNLARPIAKLCAGLTRMQEENLDVFYIQGNHEFDRHAPWLSIHPWPTHIHGVSFRVGPDAGVLVHGLDWLPKGDIQEALKTVPENTDILITHQVWRDFMGDVGRTECELTDVHHVQLVLAGDFHITKVVESVNAQGKPIRMLSPGSTAMQDMGEQPAKFFFVISEHNGKITFEAQQLKTRGTLSYVVKNAELLDDLCGGMLSKEIAALIEYAKANNYHPDIHKPLARVKFDKRLPDAYLRLMTAVGDNAHMFCEAINDRAVAKQSGTRDAAKNDLLSALADLVPETSAAYRLAAALLRAEDPTKELDIQFSNFVEDTSDAIVETGSPELGASPLSGV